MPGAFRAAGAVAVQHERSQEEGLSAAGLLSLREESQDFLQEQNKIRVFPGSDPRPSAHPGCSTVELDTERGSPGD